MLYIPRHMCLTSTTTSLPYTTHTYHHHSSPRQMQPWRYSRGPQETHWCSDGYGSVQDPVEEMVCPSSNTNAVFLFHENALSLTSNYLILFYLGTRYTKIISHWGIMRLMTGWVWRCTKRRWVSDVGLGLGLGRRVARWVISPLVDSSSERPVPVEWCTSNARRI